MKAGISTACFYPEYTEKSLEIIAAFRPACIEVFLNAEEELEPAYLKELRRVADDHGIQVVSVHPYLSGMEPMLFFSQYHRRFREGRELYKRFYQAAALLGGEILVFHGNFQGSPLPWEEYFQRFDILWEDARAYGVSLCQENVARCVSGSPDFCRAMGRFLPKVGYVLDVKQVIRMGLEPVEMAQAMGGRVELIHMSDHGKVENCLMPGTGVFHIAEFLENVSNMQQTKQVKGVVVETYRENFGDAVECFRGFQHLSAIISTLS